MSCIRPVFVVYKRFMVVFAHPICIFTFFPSIRRTLETMIASLKKELAAIRQLHDAGSFNSALSLLRQHLARPSGISNPHTALAALEQLVDVARDKSDERASRFSIVLWQTRPLLLDPSSQPLLLKLVGDKEEATAAPIFV